MQRSFFALKGYRDVEEQRRLKIEGPGRPYKIHATLDAYNKKIGYQIVVCYRGPFDP